MVCGNFILPEPASYVSFFCSFQFAQLIVPYLWNLKPIDVSSVKTQVFGLLIEGEEIVAAFRTIRDQLVFTNKRIISIDVQGLTGLKKSFAIMPYSKVQFFTIQTPCFAELVSDSELYLMFSNGFTAKFEFRGSVDIGALGRTISTYVL